MEALGNTSSGGRLELEKRWCCIRLHATVWMPFLVNGCVGLMNPERRDPRLWYHAHLRSVDVASISLALSRSYCTMQRKDPCCPAQRVLHIRGLNQPLRYVLMAIPQRHQ